MSSSAAASETPHSSHQHARSRASGATPSKSASKADAGAAGKLPAKANSSRSPAKADSSSPDQRRPSTPSPVNVQPLLPETPVSGRTTASGSPADTPSSALHSLHSTPHASQKQNAPATSSERAQSAAAQQAEAQQQQQRHGMLHLPTVSSSDVQHDPVVQLVSRRSSGRVPPPGFSGPVAPCASAALSTASRSKVRAVYFAVRVSPQTSGKNSVYDITLSKS